MMIYFDKKVFDKFSEDTNVSFYDLSEWLKSNHGEVLFLGQFLLFQGMAAHSANSGMPLSITSNILLQIASKPSSFTAPEPCNCGGGNVI